ncbi:MAG: hypothetical protein KIS78_24325 [Labilithrix sp.]|nr:hypothetical protein [Labilithrix sp.]MCW5835550.1 hypothetical protein [Labilithrix sp.]
MKRGSSSFVALLSVLLLTLLVACGGDKKEAKAPAVDNGMDDALALLPGNAIAVGTVDARAFFGSQTFGSEVAKLAEKYLPIGEEAGFQASRDVDRITWASYSYSGIDAAAIVIGRFDEAKIKEAALKQTPTKGGGMLVTSQYAGRDVYTINNVGFTVLSSTKAIAGTESGIRRVLERIKDNRVKRDIAPWMLETVETPGAASALAGDFATQPMPAEAVRQIPVPFIQSMKALRLLLTFKEPGLQIAGSLTYPDEQGAGTASEHVKQVANQAKWLALIGVKVQNVDVKTDKQDVQVTLEVDDQSLRQVLASAPAWLGQ